MRHSAHRPQSSSAESWRRDRDSNLRSASATTWETERAKLATKFGALVRPLATVLRQGFQVACSRA